MKILYVIDSMAIGGAEKQIIELSRLLLKRGHKVVVYVLQNTGKRLQELIDTGVEVVVDNKGYAVDLKLVWRLRRFIKNWEPDIAQSYLFHSNLHLNLACIFIAVPVINSERNDNYQLPIRKQILHFLTRYLADDVIANTYAGKVFAEKRYALPSDRVHVIWNGLRLNYVREALSIHRNDYRAEFFDGNPVKIVCLVGSLKPQKDHLLALEVAKNLIENNKDWRVLFVGEKPESDAKGYKLHVRSVYESLGMKDKVVFTGNRIDVLDIMQQCDVVLVTSQHEGFPNVVLEAMGVGTPVVSTDYSDIKHILPLGWQVSSDRKAAALVDMILRAQSEHDSLVELQLQWVQDNATIEHVAINHEKTYKECIRACINN